MGGNSAVPRFNGKWVITMPNKAMVEQAFSAALCIPNACYKGAVVYNSNDLLEMDVFFPSGTVAGKKVAVISGPEWQKFHEGWRETLQKANLSAYSWDTQMGAIYKFPKEVRSHFAKHAKKFLKNAVHVKGEDFPTESRVNSAIEACWQGLLKENREIWMAVKQEEKPRSVIRVRHDNTIPRLQILLKQPEVVEKQFSPESVSARFQEILKYSTHSQVLPKYIDHLNRVHNSSLVPDTETIDKAAAEFCQTFGKMLQIISSYNPVIDGKPSPDYVVEVAAQNVDWALKGNWSRLLYVALEDLAIGCNKAQ